MPSDSAAVPAPTVRAESPPLDDDERCSCGEPWVTLLDEENDGEVYDYSEAPDGI